MELIDHFNTEGKTSKIETFNRHNSARDGRNDQLYNSIDSQKEEEELYA
jgi:hypothetical protein